MHENTTGRADPDLIRRIEVRLAQLGLTEEELAGQAGMSPRYFRHLIGSGADFDPGGFLRIAVALGMTYRELLEGRRDAPAGQGGAAQHPVLVRLTTDECWARLGTHGIGRIALPARRPHPGPGVFPVNYVVDGMTVVYRTDPRGAAVPEPGSEVSFQVDHVEESRSVGWSVLLAGTAEHVTEPEAVQRLAGQHVGEPWAGGARNLWIRVVPAEISGRRIHGL
ncbi:MULTISPECIES: pyridoxamine 5'-phosphate oxidase family protein [unclassified Streptomyces]|uniref:pyridoxamine 5'-phosphate oxidase family protein n=1 Tax=unclassified Streptomyces TaxID=2593676 RepID=UPI0033F5F767